MADSSWEQSVHDAIAELWRSRNRMCELFQVYHRDSAERMQGALSEMRGILLHIQFCCEQAGRQAPPGMGILKAVMAAQMLLGILDSDSASRSIAQGGEWSRQMDDAMRELRAELSTQPSESRDEAFIPFSTVLARNEPGLATRHKLLAFIKAHKIRTTRPSTRRLKVHAADFERALMREAAARGEATKRVDEVRSRRQ